MSVPKSTGAQKDAIMKAVKQQHLIATAVAAASAASHIQLLQTLMASKNFRLPSEYRETGAQSPMPESPTSCLGPIPAHSPSEQQAEPIQEPPQNQPAEPPRQGIAGQVFSDVKLLLRLALLVFILTQGDSDHTKMIYGAVAFVFFLYQTGRLDFLWRAVPIFNIRALTHRLQRQNALVIPPPQPQPTGDTQGETQPTPQHNQQVPGRAYQIVRHLWVSILAYVMSLNPDWDPLIAAEREHQN
eukprot:c15612_g1_i1.p1 GENE.c15612_g1_i1~~c15612_g1_i1.p1  ORF type:complete len:243 (+),score=42.05 c15612_g1_i1:31-759(+)